MKFLALKGRLHLAQGTALGCWWQRGSARNSPVAIAFPSNLVLASVWRRWGDDSWGVFFRRSIFDNDNQKATVRAIKIVPE